MISLYLYNLAAFARQRGPVYPLIDKNSMLSAFNNALER
jgi:hypothetical protein